ncbi:MAG: NAD(P)/FAD-dependent oxidoreductase [Acidiferrobacterales bacterium]
MKTDIAIIGGGIVGSAIAYSLARTERSGSVTVVEPDPTYEHAATPRGAGGVRQLFSLPENIWMSKYSLTFYRDFAKIMAVEGNPAEIDFKTQGYLFVVGEGDAEQLRTNYRLQKSEGVRAYLLDRAALAQQFPSIGTADVALAVYSPDDGWFDPESALRGFRRKAESLGVHYVKDRVRELQIDNRKVTVAWLKTGDTLRAEVFINAAGAWAGEIAQMVGMALPVEPMCRLQHYWRCRRKIESLPLVKDQSGLFLRPEGQGYVGGCPSFDIPAGFMFENADGRFEEYFGDYFDRVVWPLLSIRVPKFEAIRCERTWAGHYAQNRMDGNMILGRWIRGCENFYVACGFSGHGIMHAPAMGLAIAELVLDGRFAAIDLSRLGYQRVIDNAPYPEKGII